MELVDDCYSFDCPNCSCKVLVHKNDIRCTIFRHAVYKHNNSPIPPHTTKKDCLVLLKENRVWGCAQPFKFNGNVVMKCGYI